MLYRLIAGRLCNSGTVQKKSVKGLFWSINESVLLENEGGEEGVMPEQCRCVVVSWSSCCFRLTT